MASALLLRHLIVFLQKSREDYLILFSFLTLNTMHKNYHNLQNSVEIKREEMLMTFTE